MECCLGKSINRRGFYFFIHFLLTLMSKLNSTEDVNDVFGFVCVWRGVYFLDHLIKVCEFDLAASL